MATSFEAAVELKEQANALYVAKSFSASALKYTEIFNRFLNDCPQDFIRTVYSNRAACNIVLGQYQSAIDDARQVLQRTPQELESDYISQKAHFRLARCWYEIGRYGDAIRELDDHREIFRNGKLFMAMESLRSSILQAIVARDENFSEIRPYSEPSAYPKRLRYDVKVHDELPGGSIIKYECDVPASLCTPCPPEIPTKLFLIQLVKTYHDDVMKQRQWKCWRCSALAVSLVHTPASYLHISEPAVIDYAQPVCQNGGPCDSAAREMMRDEMWLVSELGKCAK